ncbi:MAG TPA: LamG domain-containing protein [Clostridia bacterium]|nr:LamG domain-containing protein [Clostridia bacterium]
MKKLYLKTTLLVFLACTAAYSNAQTLPGLTSWWQAENNLLDAVGTNHASTYVPPPPVTPVTYQPGVSGQAFKFNGGRVTIPHHASLAPEQLTVQVWVKGPAMPGFRYVLCKSGGSTGIQYAIYTGDTGTARFFVFAGGTFVLSPAAPATVWDDNWHQLTGVWDGTGSWLYMDGVEVGFTPGSGSIDYVVPQPLVLGDYHVDGGFPYPGMLDNVKIFNTALSATDVLATYTDPNAAANTSNLVSWYKAEENADDSWGNNHGADGNGTPPPPHIFTYGEGKNGTAFFAKNGIAMAADSPSLKPETLTVQTWLKSVAPQPFRYIIAKTRGTDSLSWALYTEDGGGLDFYVNLAGIGTIKSPVLDSGFIWDGAWHLASATFDGSVVRLYVDGVQVGDGTPAVGAIDYTEPKELIFADYRLPGGLPFWGLMDDVQIYDRALTSEEILTTFKQSRLVSWWQASGTPEDAIGSNDGSLVGTTSYGVGRLAAGAFDFGAAGSVQIPDGASLRPNRITVEAMAAARTPGANKYLISKSNTASDSSYGFFTGPGGGLAFYVTTAEGRVVSPAADASMWSGSFHAIAGVYDGSMVRLYLNGKEVGNGTAASGDIVYGTYQGGKLLLGDFSETPGSAGFPGTLDDIKIYNAALNPKEVADNAFLPVLIVNQPQSQTITPGSPLTLSVLARGSSMSYQWTRGGEVLPGATDAKIVLTNPEPGNYGVNIYSGEILFTNGSAGLAYNSAAGGTLRVPNSPDFYTNTSFTLQLWAKSGGPGNFKYLISKSRHPSFYSSSYGLYTGDQNGLRMFVVLEGITTLDFIAASTGPGVWDGNWHQITGTWDGIYVGLYVDGVLAELADSFGGGNISYTNDYLNGDLVIGDFMPAPGPYHFPGALDDVKFFNRALTAQEVADTYASPTGPSGADALVNWWKLERNVVDSVGVNHGYIMPPVGSLTSATAVVSVQAPPPVLSNPQVMAGSFQANVSGATGSYVVLRSADLVNWTPIITNAAPFTFTDPTASGGRYYRVRSE